MKKEILDHFQGKENVTHIINGNGTESYLTQSRSFSDETYAIGACKLNTFENEAKHILFLFDSNDKEVGRYYMGKNLQGKTPSELIEITHSLCFFESWNPKSMSWVPCVGLLNNNPLKEIASKAISFKNDQVNKSVAEKTNLTTNVTDEDLANAWTDEYGVMYSADKKRLLRITDELISYSIRKGTQVICDKAFNWVDDEDSYIFSYNDTLESIIIPDSVTKIGNNAFRNCINLGDVVLSDSLIQIRNNAFSGCRALVSISLPVTLRDIGDEAFCGCEALTSIRIPESLSRLGDSVFSECAFSQITIPNSIREIGDFAFYNCSSLKKVAIPKSVNKFGIGVFGGCPLLEVNIPESLTEIGHEFFSGSMFTQITIPNWITKIGGRAFYGSRLTQISIPDSVSFIGESAFADSCLHEITIPNSIREIADSTFSGSSLTKIEMPNSVKKIGHVAFNYCQFLNNVVVPDSVLEIGNGAFQYCDSLTRITFLGKVSHIGDAVFNDCNSLKQIFIPEGSRLHYEKLLSDYKSILVEEGCTGNTTNNDNSLDAQILDHFGKTMNRSVKMTSHLILLKQLVNNSMFSFKHPSYKSDLPSFMWNEEGLFMESDSILPYTIPFMWIRTLAKRNVEKFNEVIDFLNKEFGVEVSEVIDVEDIVKGIRLYGFNDFNPNFDVHANKKLLSTFYGDCLSVNNFILLFGFNIDMNDLLPSRSNNINIQSESLVMNNIISEIVNDFRNGKIEGN